MVNTEQERTSDPQQPEQPQQQQQKQRIGSGVADYFAILGVGEELVWKHTQKTTGFETVQNDQEEDETALRERFDREIVSIHILTTPSDPDNTTTAATTNSGGGQTQQLPQINNNVVGNHPSLSNNNKKNHELSSAIQHSASETSEATTVVHDGTTTTTTPAVGSGGGFPPNHDETQQQQQHNGLTIIEKTCPAGRSSSAPDPSILSVSTAAYPNSINESSMTSHPSRENNIDRNSGGGRDTNRRGPDLWSKQQVFDANLDPLAGLRAEFARAAAMMSEDNDNNRGGGGGGGGGGRGVSGDATPLRGLRQGLRRKVGSTIRNLVEDHLDLFKGRQFNYSSDVKFHMAYRRRSPEEQDKPAIADLALRYVRIHKLTVSGPTTTTTTPTTTTRGGRPSEESDAVTSASTDTKTSNIMKQTLLRVAEAGKDKVMERYEKYRNSPTNNPQSRQFFQEEAAALAALQHAAGAGEALFLPLEEIIACPDGYDEWSIPDDYSIIKIPHPKNNVSGSGSVSSSTEKKVPGTQEQSTYLFPRGNTQAGTNDEQLSDASGVGMEAFLDHPGHESKPLDPEVYMPQLLPEPLPDFNEMDIDVNYVYIPIIAIRRQRVGEEERYHEDPGIVDAAMSFCDHDGAAVMPAEYINFDEDDEEEDEGAFSLTGKTSWTRSGLAKLADGSIPTPLQRPPTQAFGAPVILVRRNMPAGFADAPFATRVLDRFPIKNYKQLPLPEEELPMFCYPTGCRLHRARFSDAPLAEYYGFVVKNERGDSIHVSCVSFMEPLTSAKNRQLAKISNRRRHTSLPHRRFCEREARQVARERHQVRLDTSSSVSGLGSQGAVTEANATHGTNGTQDEKEDTKSDTSSMDEAPVRDNFLLHSFDEMTTFENKTICLISRHPFWTAFRRFLSHLHILSGSSSDLPLERWISHLLLTVPVPKPGLQAVIVPLPTLNGPMVLSLPPTKDFPIVDLPFQRLLACLDVPTIVTVVLGFLALERKLIVMSSRPSLVLDVCELLKSLLFPFDLCAPYVPRLTEPFMSCLDFPGALFVGIHDDGTEGGLAAIVRKSLPEDSAIVNLDTGEIDCSGDRYEVLKQCWGIIPAGPRSMLISEIETLCRDAGVVPGQEPLDSQIDSAFGASIPTAMVEDYERGHRVHEPLDDRAVRDSFLRFFCSVLGGYERFLVVPDADYMISGNDWFDSQKFLAAASQDRAPYLGSLVTTQIFQSFIQRRTEASDVHCLLFDECLVEYHSAPVPYGRLGGDVEALPSSDEGQPQMLYSLLVDQCATEAQQNSDTSIEPTNASLLSDSDTDSSSHMLFKEYDYQKSDEIKKSLSHHSFMKDNDEFMLNQTGDIVTAPTHQDLAYGSRFMYCIDGNPCFPQQLNADLFLPREPDSLLFDLSKTPEPLLARSEREIEEANRRRKMATTYRGLNNQRRCLWQLPKLMGSHFLGTFLMCIPSQVSQANLTQEQQSKFILRALGALRILRNKQRLVPDEAAYRALMVACGRSDRDRRVEIVKLFGLLRSDGIFPSAVTLGQYTRAIAEGFSKRATGVTDDALTDIGTGTEFKQVEDSDLIGILDSLDSNAEMLEDSGRRWRQRHQNRAAADGGAETENDKDPNETSNEAEKARKRLYHKSWNPVAFSSSFLPATEKAPFEDHISGEASIRLFALWSKTISCRSCSYTPLDEEVQGGWDVVGGELEIPGAIACPRCGAMVVPMIGYREMSIEEALQTEEEEANLNKTPENDDCAPLPVQVRPLDNNDESDQNASFVTYLSPVSMRESLERHVNEQGEEILQRDKLRELDPELFFNLWWYCARFSLPFPLPVYASNSSDPSDSKKSETKHYCAYAAWNKSIAERGCSTAAITLRKLTNSLNMSRGKVMATDPGSLSILGSFDDYPLLGRFSLQTLSQGDWDHIDLAAVLVTMVDACDKRDFRPVVECVLRCNKRRKEELALSMGLSQRNVNDSINDQFSDVSTMTTSVELDCYRTLLYLAKYQCTTAFHVFFPATMKPCKGYHFWCPSAPLPMFDRLFRDAVKRIRAREGSFTPLHDVSDVALGFRCVFGHCI